MTLDKMIKKLGVINTGIDMKIVMKSDATERQIELAKEFYPKAVVIKEVKEEKLDYSQYIGYMPCFTKEEIIFDAFNIFGEDMMSLEDFYPEKSKDTYPEKSKDTPLYYELAA